MNRLVKQKGFTIIELMVATAVFSSVLLLCTTGLIQIGRTYYKGLISSQTQNTSRSIIDFLTQAIQTSTTAAATYTPGTGYPYVCIGDTRITYSLDKKLVDSSPGSSETLHAMVADIAPSCGALTAGQDLSAASVSAGSIELLNANTRITEFKIEPLAGTSLSQVTVRIVYGDIEAYDSGTNQCFSNKQGGQFCATSRLVTTVQRRL